jgi:hypothetical protein
LELLLFYGNIDLNFFYNQEFFKQCKFYPEEYLFETNINNVALSKTTTNLLEYRVKLINFGEDQKTFMSTIVS